MNKTFSKILSAVWWASEIVLLIWLYGYATGAGLLGAARDFLFYSVLLWVAFAGLMRLKRHAETHAWPRSAVALLRALFSIGYVYDVWFNTRYGTLAFFEFPPVRVIHLGGIKIKHRFEPLTARLKRHYLATGWRGNTARFLCDNLVHPNDPGHCI